MKQLDVREWSLMFDMLIGYATSSEAILDFLLRVLQEFGDEVVNRQQTSRFNQQKVSLIVNKIIFKKYYFYFQKFQNILKIFLNYSNLSKNIQITLKII